MAFKKPSLKFKAQKMYSNICKKESKWTYSLDNGYTKYMKWDPIILTPYFLQAPHEKFVNAF